MESAERNRLHSDGETQAAQEALGGIQKLRKAIHGDPVLSPGDGKKNGHILLCIQKYSVYMYVFVYKIVRICIQICVYVCKCM